MTLVYRQETEGPPVLPLRLKVEINTREHFSAMGLLGEAFSVGSAWFSGRSEVTTFHIEELLGTKLRALYQRRKGRDLFDLWWGLSHGGADPVRIAECFRRYMERSGHAVQRKELAGKVEKKLRRRDFRSDTDGLLRPGMGYDPRQAWEVIKAQLLPRL